MFERKEAIINNKKYFMSHDYIRKLFESNNSHRNMNSNDNNYTNFKKVDIIQKIGISNDQPLVLFHKPNSKHIHSLENKIKKDLIDNKGYLNDGGYNKKLAKYISYHNTEQNASKNIFRSTCSQNKNRSKMNGDQNILNSKRTSFSMGLNKRRIRKDYSNSIKKLNRRPNIKHIMEGQDPKKKLFNSISIKKDNNFKNLFIKKIINKNNIKKNLYESAKYKKSNKKDNDYKRKKEYLELNGISYEHDTEVENEKNNQNVNNNKCNKNNNSNDIKNTKNVNIHNANVNDINNFNNKKPKKIYKAIVNQFEFLQKIKKEMNNLRKSREKDEGYKSTNKN